MLTTYIVEGGIGKTIAFSAVVEALAEKNGEPVQIFSPYYECFVNNPYVKLCIDANTVNVMDEVVQRSDKIVYFEPYKSTFIKGKQHLIESFCEVLGIEPKINMSPKIYTEHLEETAKETLNSIGVSGEYMIVQFSGGQSPVGFDRKNQYFSIDPARNYPPFLAQKVINIIKQNQPNISILNFSLPNEPNYEGTIKPEINTMVWHELLKNAQGFISIDSCLNHFSPSANKRGVVLWGNTRWSQFGYELNTNMNYWNLGVFDESKFDPRDPRNIMVDPYDVVDFYERTVSLSFFKNKETKELNTFQPST